MKRLLLAALLALAPLHALGASLVWNPAPIQIRRFSTGAIAPGAKINFYLQGTTTRFTIYQDAAQTTPHANPVEADSQGFPPPIYVPYSSTGYRVYITTSGGTVISDTDGIARDAPPSSGGGGGITVSTEQVFQPGDAKWRCQTGTHTGFVRANGRTLGSATSGATERANADTSDLFSFVWTNCSNTYCAVSGGRGASATADFAANKTIALPDVRGRSFLNLEDEGNSAANVAQVSPTINTTSGSPTATVSSATGVVVGQFIVSTNVTSGTTVSAVSGTTITMSANATGTASGAAARFSQFQDAQVIMAPGGGSTRTILTEEMPSHTHIQDSHVHLETTTAFSSVAQAGGTANVGSSAPSQNTGATTATNQNTGGGRPHGIQSPAVICGLYLKL